MASNPAMARSSVVSTARRRRVSAISRTARQAGPLLDLKGSPPQERTMVKRRKESSEGTERNRRLAAALKDNIKRRKDQARERAKETTEPATAKPAQDRSR